MYHLNAIIFKLILIKYQIKQKKILNFSSDFFLPSNRTTRYRRKHLICFVRRESIRNIIACIYLNHVYNVYYIRAIISHVRQRIRIDERFAKVNSKRKKKQKKKERYSIVIALFFLLFFPLLLSFGIIPPYFSFF